MGAVLQTAGVAELAAELTCCACSSICGLAARDSATRAKFRYCSFLLLATVTCVIALIPGLRMKLDKIPNLCTKVVSPDTCDKFVGFNAVYRIIFAMAAFHFILAILTLRVTRVNSFRARFNNGLWMFKMGLIFGLTFATFYIPKRTVFFRIWMYLSLTGGFMFLMFQIILVIDFGYSWSLSWAEKLEAGHTKLWYAAMGVVTLLMFAVSFGAIIAFYNYFTHPTNIMKCNANFFYISFMGVQCILAVAISVTPSVQQDLAGAGLLQSSVVVLYALYLTWNTLSSEPDSSCNPLGNIILEYDSFTGVSGGAIFGCLLTLILLVFACTVRTGTSHLGKYGLALAESEIFAMATYYEDQTTKNNKKQAGKEGVHEVEKGNNNNNDDEVSLADYVGYNYSFFHIIMSFASLHILMVLTNWHSPEENTSMKTLVKNWPSVWVQMASSFACILMYIWFLVTPLVKRVWGPTFGINFNETVVYEKSIRGNLFAMNNKQRRTPDPKPIINQQPIPRDSDSIEPITAEKPSLTYVPPSNNNTLDYALKDKENNLMPNKEKFDSSVESFAPRRPVSRKLSRHTDEISESFAPRGPMHRKLSRQIDEITKSKLVRQGNQDNSSKYGDHLSEHSMMNKNNNTMDRFSTVSTSTKNINIYDYKSRRRRRNRISRAYDATSNSSIESINSWVSTAYREKYQPLKHYEQFDSDCIIEEERLSLLEDTTHEIPFKTRIQNKDREILRNDLPDRLGGGNKRRSPSKSSKMHQDTISVATTMNTLPNARSNKPPCSSLTIKIRKSSHRSDFSKCDNDVDDDVSRDAVSRKRKKRKLFTKRSRNLTKLHPTKPNQKLRLLDQKNESTLDERSPKSQQNSFIFPSIFPNSRTNKSHTYSHSILQHNNENYNRISHRDSVLKPGISVTREELPESNDRPNKSHTQYSHSLLQQSIENYNPRNKKDSVMKPGISVSREELAESKIEETNNSQGDRKNHTAESKISHVTQNISLVPSIFKHKAQSTETASELLKLQWKILRTQAKIVKIQERIYRLQNGGVVDLKEACPKNDVSRNSLLNVQKKSTRKH